jgi:hypothetical protein
VFVTDIEDWTLFVLRLAIATRHHELCIGVHAKQLFMREGHLMAE